MISFNNDDLYQMLLNRLRKDRKGSVSPSEFENFLRWRNIDYFNGQYKVTGMSQANLDSLRAFTIFHEPAAVTQEAATGMYYVWIKVIPTGTTTTTDFFDYLESAYAHLINAWYSPSATVWSTVVEIDILSHTEYHERVNNAITGPSATYPIAYLEDDRLWLGGIASNYVLLDYYRYPTDPYYDYYTDPLGNITYLTEGQAAYTLLASEIARDGSVAGDVVTSASVDLEWEDQDAINILDMIVSDVSVALSDSSSFEASMLERKENVTS